jgi:hypothetical protein
MLREQKESMTRRALAAFALFAILALGACSSRVFLPVQVTELKVSPPYVVSFVNETGAPFDVLPTASGREAGHPIARVHPGATFKTVLQLRRVKVGAGSSKSSVSGVQIAEGPYFEPVIADKSEVRFMQGEPRSSLFSFQHSSWFSEHEWHDDTPTALLVPVREFSLSPLFPRGPRGGP